MKVAKKTIAASVFVLALCALTGVGMVSRQSKVYADVFGTIFMGTTPPAITTDTTATFTFNGFHGRPDDPTECKVDNDAYTPCTDDYNGYTTHVLGGGSHTFTVHVIDSTNPDGIASYTWNILAIPSFTGGSTVSGNLYTPIAISDLQISESSADDLSVKLSATHGSLAMSNTHGLTFSGSHTGSSLQFSGSWADLNAALASLTFTPTQTGSITITATLPGKNDDNLNMAGDRFFQVVHTSGIDWADAKTAAEASSFHGTPGYLANITSANMDSLLRTQIGNDAAWFDGSDAANEGDWRWMGGPENTTAFSSGGTAVGGAFTNWVSGDPDNFNGDENCTELYASGWNDQDCTRTNNVYIIEYGDGATIPNLDVKTLTVTSTSSNDNDGDGITDITENTAPNSGDANDDGTSDSQQANVTSQQNAINNKYVVVQTGCAANMNVQIGAESSEHPDTAYSYPDGLVDFTGRNCGTPGSSIPITLYFYGNLDSSKFVLRKWNPTTKTYATINDAVLSNVTINGQAVLKVTYNVTDGGALDFDGAADGNIRDPVGIATSNSTNQANAPDTGYGTPAKKLSSGLFVLAGLSLLATITGIFLAQKKTQ